MSSHAPVFKVLFFHVCFPLSNKILLEAAEIYGTLQSIQSRLLEIVVSLGQLAL